MTESGLPVVTRETIGGVIESEKNSSGPWGRRLEQTRKILNDEQPEMVVFLGQLLREVPEEIHPMVLERMLAVYALLDQQARVNLLNLQISLEPKT